MYDAFKSTVATAGLVFGLLTPLALLFHDAEVFGDGPLAALFGIALVAGGFYAIAHAAVWFGRRHALAPHWRTLRLPGLVIGVLTIAGGLLATGGAAFAAAPLAYAPMLAGFVTVALSVLDWS